MPNRPPVVPCHYHLSKETWVEVVEAYRSGATARELAGMVWRLHSSLSQLQQALPVAAEAR